MEKHGTITGLAKDMGAGDKEKCNRVKMVTTQIDRRSGDYTKPPQRTNFCPTMCMVGPFVIPLVAAQWIGSLLPVLVSYIMSAIQQRMHKVYWNNQISQRQCREETPHDGGRNGRSGTVKSDHQIDTAVRGSQQDVTGEEDFPKRQHLKVVRMPPDGSCGFHSIAYGLNDGSTAESIREEVTTYIKNHPTDEINGTTLKDWICYDTDEKTTPQMYAKRMANKTEYGGGIELAVVCIIKKVTIQVYGKDATGVVRKYTEFKHGGNDQTQQNIDILFDPKREHYDALEKVPRQPSTQGGITARATHDGGPTYATVAGSTRRDNSGTSMQKGAGCSEERPRPQLQQQKQSRGKQSGGHNTRRRKGSVIEEEDGWRTISTRRPTERKALTPREMKEATASNDNRTNATDGQEINEGQN